MNNCEISYGLAIIIIISMLGSYYLGFIEGRNENEQMDKEE